MRLSLPPWATPGKILLVVYASAFVATVALLVIGGIWLEMHPLGLMMGALMIWVPLGYGMPTIVALARRHRLWYVILLGNLLLGFTILGWIACLIWSFGPYRQPAPFARRYRR